MAEAITYADLRFVKAPLKKSVSSRSGQETDEDEELTYENVQVPSVSVSGGPLSLASSGVGDKAEQPTASWSSVASPVAGRILTGEYGALPTCAPRPPPHPAPQGLRSGTRPGLPLGSRPHITHPALPPREVIAK
uniref:CD72 molecule n=1 Tax=Lynx canadensis TaxID=61383 RepID=A0A667IEI1_LYNCA